MAPPSKYTPGFREEAVQIALRSSKTISEVGRELGINPETPRGWVNKHKKRNEPAADAELALSERARLKELERRNRELEMEDAFLLRPWNRQNSRSASRRRPIAATARHRWLSTFRPSNRGIGRETSRSRRASTSRRP
ncbi:transposase [Streptomyces buecherae]|uniref:transposase n=1 Tax=Streptomyces buecherae TaxID=2763006 RepID=UPI0033F997E9